MTNAPNDLLSQLYDIRGLGHISWWPLAPGWWALLALVSLIGAVVYWRRRAYWRSWKGDARRALDRLDARLSGENAQEIAGGLSTLLRRIAMQRYSREECAGLRGEDWLRWLTQKDPGGFDWVGGAVLILEAPYAPPGRDIAPKNVKGLIAAARRWVR
jgi:hypothetical protein